MRFHSAPKSRRYTEAIDAYKQAMSIKPDFVPALHGLGMAYLRRGDKDAALEQYKILKGLDPDAANELLKEINK